MSTHTASIHTPCSCRSVYDIIPTIFSSVALAAVIILAVLFVCYVCDSMDGDNDNRDHETQAGSGYTVRQYIL